MKLKILLFFFFMSLAVNAQFDKIEIINFKYSLNINTVKISIYPSFSNRNDMILKSQVNDAVKEIQISKEDLKQLQEALININVKDLCSNFEKGLDGATTKISFGNFWNEITYSVWGLSKYDSKTPFKDFLIATELILKLANIKISELN